MVEKLNKAGCRVVCTEYPGHAEVIARETDAGVVVAVGGDGTVNEVARGLLGSDKVLGIIPCGSGDGLALHLGLSRDFKKSMQILQDGKVRCIDSAVIGDKVFFSVCGVGFDAVVSERFAKSGKRGLLNYIRQGISLMTTYRPEKYELEIDGDRVSRESMLITIGNSDQWGNRAKITPLADISDGLLDITAVERFGLLSAPSLGFRLMTGSLDRSRKVRSFKGKEVCIRRTSSGPAHFDGDWFEAGEEIDIKIVPNSLKVIVP